ncbi:MAG: putative signal transducing protein [Gemmatimonadaceae bacterium]
MSFSNDIVVLRTFTYEHEARIAQAALESHGIPSMLKSDSAAGMLAFVHGISIAVRVVDRERALRIISEKV